MGNDCRRATSSGIQHGMPLQKNKVLLTKPRSLLKDIEETEIKSGIRLGSCFQRECLNDTLITGPVLINDLPVLIKFREVAMAFSADTDAIFSRVRMRAEDSARILMERNRVRKNSHKQNEPLNVWRSLLSLCGHICYKKGSSRLRNE